ncbi:hypothetical protein BDP81DRAFT_400789 [Colletotrichum phormii]|uniref:Carrier domain-containing protein n=1 Tax=Colletotrichum phormii TaxID=359342 RepID=A0AAI9ZCA6_9PEZI|nr:uncharacterized protein BDP81DRAFT_400789 [Colletotrichum phormii]KAK1621889.1 hypothetical protein BDP81DRAFT_400789 [Colletotrichum phormii]
MVRAVWAIVGYGNTDLEDIVFGATVSGRGASLPGIETIVGPTIATVPVRVHIQPQQQVLDYLREVQDDFIEMIPFKQAGLQAIAKASPEARRAYDFQTLLVVQPPDENLLTASSFGRWRTRSGEQAFSTYSVSVSILAVLKTGGAFLILNLAHPELRLYAIIEQADTTIILISVLTNSLGSRLVEQAVVIGNGLIPDTYRIIALPNVDPLSLIYAIFTSGSTGLPKGVLVSHTAFASNVHYQADELGFKPLSRVYDFANHAFDMFIHSMVTTLAKGGCLCIPSEQDRTDNLMASMINARVTLLSLTSSVSRLLDPAQLPLVERVLLGGEPVTLCETELWGVKKVVNMYGPAECTPVTVVNAKAETPEAATSIGKGAGAVTWVVDLADHNSLMPIGNVGELLLEGPLLGLGYLKDPEKTVAAFIRDLTWLVKGTPQHPGRYGVLYKTGDLIRACLPQAQEAEQVAAEVIVPSGDGASPMLAIFLSDVITTADSQATLLPIPNNMEDRLAEHLPNYMIPAVIFTLSRLPLTATGKTDRKQLREMASQTSVDQLLEMRRQKRHGHPTISTKAEVAMQQIWGRILCLEADGIGADDSFFGLGGDSISAMKLVVEARQAGLTLTVADVFRNPRLSALSRLSLPIRHADALQEELTPFTLLADTVHIPSFRRRIAAVCGLDVRLIEDAYPCTPCKRDSSP